MDKIFYNVNSKFISELIKDSKKRIIYVSPGINKKIFGEILEVKDKIGVDNIRIIIDASSNVLRYGYGDEESISYLDDNKSFIKNHPGIRIGFICIDDDGYIYSPTPLSLENEGSSNNCPNAINVKGSELEKILMAVAPKSLSDKNIIEIGKNDINSEEIQKIKSELKIKPLVKPDLQRQLNVINSKFQIVKLDFEGSKLQNKTYKINAKDLGITNIEIAEKISTTYKIFKSLPLPNDFENMEINLNEIKREYLDQVDNVGLLLMNEKYIKFNEEIDKFKEKIKSIKTDNINMINKILERSRSMLVDFIVGNLMKLSLKEKEKLIPYDTPTKNKLKDYVSNKLKREFPDANQLLKNMELNLKIFNISDQLIKDKKFVERIEKHFNKSFDEIVNVEKALGTKENINELNEVLN